MRPLAYGRYSDAEVASALHDADPKFGRRFEILDRGFNVVGELDNVISASIEHSVDRDHKGALTLTLGAFEDLRGQLLKRLIRPYFQLRMPDQGWVEYPLGAYLWVEPERSLPTPGSEEWKVTLADQCWRLSYTSPELSGFSVNRNQKVTDLIRDIYAGLGYTNLDGIADSDETMGETKVWIFQTPNTPEYGQRKDLQQQLDRVRRDLESATEDTVKTELGNEERTILSQLLELDTTAPPADNTFVSWGAILAMLQAGIGYNGPYFDWTGTKPIAQPARDLAVEGADHHYRTDGRSILESITITPDLSSIGNRVWVKAANADGLYGVATADANDLYPNHPLAQRNILDYITVPIEDSTAGSSEALQARANKELGERLAKHRNCSVRVGPNPAHEPYDLVGLTWTGDPDLGEEVTFTQRSFQFDLDDPIMDLDLGLVAG